MAYGVHHPDALELRGRVWAGEDWRSVATELADSCLSPPEAGVSPPTRQSQINRLFRASALTRMSQMMMLGDSPERSAIFARAGELYGQAAALAGDRQREVIETPNGPLIGWFFPAAGPEVVGAALLIGGVEGWAMDFSEMATALAARGIDTLSIDGPGQGESRMVLGHLLTDGWEAAYAAAIDWLARRSEGRRIGVVGNSMGGSFAMHLAARHPAIAACCNNGGTSAPAMARANATFFQKMTAFVGDVSGDEAQARWAAVRPADPDAPVRCPLLVVHGGLDPMINDADARNLFQTAQAADKQMVVFSDGDHCIYNHPDDKLSLVGDWLASRLGGP
ncbi:alpha/beta hydrolase family protein [Phenylobacterium sp.]|uniref:alpha/beta hydrolase family protein n=1 Tax=Phenylobacterium sp. TaxID=1871053 RepID=UPI002FC91679